MIEFDPDELPRDPDVPEELQLLQGIDDGQVIVLDADDGVSHDTLVIAPGLFAHARRLREGED